MLEETSCKLTIKHIFLRIFPSALRWTWSGYRHRSSRCFINAIDSSCLYWMSYLWLIAYTVRLWLITDTLRCINSRIEFSYKNASSQQTQLEWKPLDYICVSHCKKAVGRTCGEPESKFDSKLEATVASIDVFKRKHANYSSGRLWHVINEAIRRRKVLVSRNMIRLEATSTQARERQSDRIGLVIYNSPSLVTPIPFHPTASQQIWAEHSDSQCPQVR